MTVQLSEPVQTSLKSVEKEFTVDKKTLDKIIEYFIEELERGLVDGTDPLGIPMNLQWVMEYPTGEETGDFLALDFGGTNLRVVMVHLLGNCKLETEQAFYKLPHGMRTTKDRNELFQFMADCIEKFLVDKHPSGIPKDTVFPLGFTFSYPASQTRIDSGVLQRWTKGFDIPGVEGEDVVPLLMEKLNAKNVPVKVVALINDTCGALVASRYADPKTEMGCIFGTGVNGSYYEVASNIKKFAGKLPKDIKPDSPMLINCEYGSFDNLHKVIPRTQYDLTIDEMSPRPGQQTFEKATAGFYLGDLLRLVLLKYQKEGVIFKNAGDETTMILNTDHCIDSSFLSFLEADESSDLSIARALFDEHFKYSNPSFEDLYFAKEVSKFIGTRAARLSICGIGAACKKRGYTDCHVAADGSLFMKYTHFPERAAQGLAEVFNWPEGMPMKDHPIKIVESLDGSGVGAAVIAALAHNRQVKGLSLGLE
jgi:hexokinase